MKKLKKHWEQLPKNKRLSILFFLLMVTIFITVSYSYAYFTKNVEGGTVNIQAGDISYSLEGEGLNENYQATVTAGSQTEIRVKVTGQDNVASKYQMYYTSSNALTDVVVGYSSESTDLPSGEMEANGTKNVTIVIKNNSSSDVTITIGVRGGLSKYTVEDITFSAKEHKIIDEINSSKSIMDLISTKVDTTTTINFDNKSSATNGRGIYKYQENNVDVYYWRGAVTENHVIFNNMCWEMVRTTKDGGLKIIYDGLPIETDGVLTCPNTGSASQLSTTSAFNSSQYDNAYVGYMYGMSGITTSANRCITHDSANNKAIDSIATYATEEACENAGGKWTITAYEATHANVVNSTVKTIIDSWYKENMTNITNKLEDAIYCNDRSIGSGLGYGTNETTYAPKAKLGSDITNIKPRLECPNQNDSFTINKENGNGDLTYPVGLITADEVALAGGRDAAANSDYYLRTTSSFMTLSPFTYVYNGHRRYFVDSDGGLYSNYGYNSFGIRPVVTLASGTKFAEEGTGTSSNPYIVLD